MWLSSCQGVREYMSIASSHRRCPGWWSLDMVSTLRCSFPGTQTTLRWKLDLVLISSVKAVITALKELYNFPLVHLKPIWSPPNYVFFIVSIGIFFQFPPVWVFPYIFLEANLEFIPNLPIGSNWIFAVCYPVCFNRAKVQLPGIRPGHLPGLECNQIGGRTWGTPFFSNYRNTDNFYYWQVWYSYKNKMVCNSILPYGAWKNDT